jgi:hypothetical protein
VIPQDMMLTLPTKGDAVLIFDDTGFLKQGQSSVGATPASYASPTGQLSSRGGASPGRYLGHTKEGGKP